MTGMENQETSREMISTRGEIATLEQSGSYTLSSDQVFVALGENSS